MEKGDIIRVSIIRQIDLGPDHFGVFDGNGGVYHFQGFDFDSAKIVHTSLSEFEKGGTSSVCNYYTKEFSNDVIIERAKTMVGTNFDGYNLLTNNCEHFATWCATGKKICMQTSSINNSENTDQSMIDKYKEFQNEKYSDITQKLDKVFTNGELNSDVRESIGTVLNQALNSGLLDSLFKK